MTRQGRRSRRGGRAGALALLFVLLACTTAGRAIAAAPPVPTLTQAPIAAGTLVRGSVVSATAGAWTDSPTTYVYVWQRDDGSSFATIGGATAATYTLGAADVGASVRALI